MAKIIRKENPPERSGLFGGSKCPLYEKHAFTEEIDSTSGEKKVYCDVKICQYKNLDKTTPHEKNNNHYLCKSGAIIFEKSKLIEKTQESTD